MRFHIGGFSEISQLSWPQRFIVMKCGQVINDFLPSIEHILILGMFCQMFCKVQSAVGGQSQDHDDAVHCFRWGMKKRQEYEEMNCFVNSLTHYLQCSHSFCSTRQVRKQRGSGWSQRALVHVLRKQTVWEFVASSFQSDRFTCKYSRNCITAIMFNFCARW